MTTPTVDVRASHVLVKECRCLHDGSGYMLLHDNAVGEDAEIKYAFKSAPLIVEQLEGKQLEYLPRIGFMLNGVQVADWCGDGHILWKSEAALRHALIA